MCVVEGASRFQLDMNSSHVCSMQECNSITLGIGVLKLAAVTQLVRASPLGTAGK